MQEVHHSVQLDLHQGHLPKAWDRFHPGGNVVQEGVYPSSGSFLCGQRSTVLPRDIEPFCQFPDNIIGESAGPKHLPHQPRRPRGVEVDHDGQGKGVRLTAVSPAPTRPVPVWVIDSATLNQGKGRKRKLRVEHKGEFPVFLTLPVFWEP